MHGRTVVVVASICIAAAVAAVAAQDEGAPPIANGESAAHAPPPPPEAVWAFRPKTVREMADASEAIVLAYVTRVEDGPALIPKSTSDDTGEGAVPTQRIHFRTSRALTGSDELTMRADAPFVVFRTGGQGSSTGPLTLEGDPDYNLGERYALFLRTRAAADGTLLPVAPDGRLRITPGGTLQPLIEGPVADALSGKSVDELEAVVNG